MTIKNNTNSINTIKNILYHEKFIKWKYKIEKFLKSDNFPKLIVALFNIVKIIFAIYLMVFTSSRAYEDFKNKSVTLDAKVQYNSIEQNNIHSVHGFSFLNNNTRGPISINEELDNGKKTNIYSLLKDAANKRKEEENEDDYFSEQSIFHQRIAIVMYSDSVENNSLTENAISEFYQYSNIHGYKFLFFNQRYDKERESNYMKLHSVIEAISLGLNSKSFEWVFWVDSDVILANPNIKLQTFLPTDPNIHFIAANRDGLNSGVYLIRVSSWSLNFLIQAATYPYFRGDTYLKDLEEASLNNVLVEFANNKNYVIVPPHWFNSYPNQYNSGDFLIHFSNRKKIGTDTSEKIRDAIRKNPVYILARTNKALRQEILKYYHSKKNQLKISKRNS